MNKENIYPDFDKKIEKFFEKFIILAFFVFVVPVAGYILGLLLGLISKH
jgi:hypothetical protein